MGSRSDEKVMKTMVSERSSKYVSNLVLPAEVSLKEARHTNQASRFLLIPPRVRVIYRSMRRHYTRTIYIV